MSRPEPSSPFEPPFELGRRRFLTGAAAGLGSLLFAPSLRGMPLAPGLVGGLPELPHHLPRAKRIVWLHMAGGPSSLDLFDPKPKLVEHDGEETPESFTEGERFAFIEGTPKLLGSPYSFAQHGESGAWVSELLPHTAGIVDKLCMVKTMRTTQFNHAPAQLFLTSGYERVGRPSIGRSVAADPVPPTIDVEVVQVDLEGGRVDALGEIGRPRLDGSVRVRGTCRADGVARLVAVSIAFGERHADRLGAGDGDHATAAVEGGDRVPVANAGFDPGVTVRRGVEADRRHEDAMMVTGRTVDPVLDGGCMLDR